MAKFRVAFIATAAWLASVAVVGAETGVASYYARDFDGRRTASGEIFNPREHTAASRRYDLGTLVRVTNLGNGRTAVVRINDRGPYAENRILDLSPAAAGELGMLKDGVAPVRVTPLARNETP